VFAELALLYRAAGRAHVIGFTGSPGVGKSTLVDRVVSRFRQDGKTVGILAVDPTSPFTGGAILGDRIRMQNTSWTSVFIRSMATAEIRRTH
jgi:LAO/AO transport system kinase